MKHRISMYIFLMIFSLNLAAENTRGKIIRSGRQVMHVQPMGKVVAGKQYFLFIAIDKYKKWRPLSGPVSETRDLKKVLTRKYHTDEVKELYDEKATKEAIRNVLLGLQEGGENALAQQDSLFIFFSGHGQAFEEESDTGYWIPYNGGRDESARSHWLSNSELTGLIKKIKCRHILVVSDSCFASTLVSSTRGGHPSFTKLNLLQRCYDRSSRKILTSGGIEPVPGDSVFADLFKRELLENTQPWISIEDIYGAIRKKLYAKTGNYPELGNLKNTRYNPSGSFFLFTHEGWDQFVISEYGKKNKKPDQGIVSNGLRIYYDKKPNSRFKGNGKAGRKINQKRITIEVTPKELSELGNIKKMKIVIEVESGSDSKEIRQPIGEFEAPTF